MIKYLVIFFLCVSAWANPFGPLMTGNVAAGGTTGGGAISFNAANDNHGAAATTLTISVTINQATDGYVIVGAGGWDNTAGSTISSCTFDGVAMTALYANASIPGSVADIRTFGLAIGNKSAGTYNAVITYSANYNETAGGVTVWNNVHQTTSTGTVPTTTTGSTSTPSITATTAAGEVVVDNLIWWSGAASVGASQTQRYNEQTDPGDVTDAASSSQAGADGGVMSWTAADGEAWGMQAVPLKPANP